MQRVNKVWGTELWIVNRDYCGKLLYLNKDSQCSLHYHKIKDETFYILKGKVQLEYKGNVRIMNEGEEQHIAKGMPHRFKGLEDSVMIEFSTHHDDKDSYRLEESKK